jgi:hypothetical protein
LKNDCENANTHAQRDSGVFVEMKRLFSIAPKDEKGGEVAGVFLAEKQASDARFGGVRRGHRVYCLTLVALCWCVSTKRAGGQATDVWRQRPLASMSAPSEDSAALDTGRV